MRAYQIHCHLAGHPNLPSSMAVHSHIERVLWTHDQISARVSDLASQISIAFHGASSPPVLVGVATGAFIFLADLVRHINIPIAVDFVRVESYGFGTHSNGAPTISSDLKVDVKNKHVILVFVFYSLCFRHWIIVLVFFFFFSFFLVPVSYFDENIKYFVAIWFVSLCLLTCCSVLCPMAPVYVVLDSLFLGFSLFMPLYWISEVCLW